MASHWHDMVPPNPGMLPSQSHSHLVNGLINILKGPLPTQVGVHPLLCLAASLLSLSSAMVRRMPFPRGREIHGLLPCSKGKEATSHHETQTGAELSPSGGKSSRSQPCPWWATYTWPWHWHSRSPLGRCRRCTGLYLPLLVTSNTKCASAKTKTPPLSNLDKRAHQEWRDSTGTGGEGTPSQSSCPGHIKI